jgi:hypothetical protein
MSRAPGTFTSTTCGTCCETFYGKTPQDAAGACRAHVEAGCLTRSERAQQARDDADRAARRAFAVGLTEPRE